MSQLNQKINFQTNEIIAAIQDLNSISKEVARLMTIFIKKVNQVQERESNEKIKP